MLFAYRKLLSVVSSKSISILAGMFLSVYFGRSEIESNNIINDNKFVFKDCLHVRNFRGFTIYLVCHPSRLLW